MHDPGMDDLSRFQFPAWELVLMRDSNEWPRRFEMAGGQLRNGRMVALKVDAVWTELGWSAVEAGLESYGDAISREVSREECIELGLITGDEMPGFTDARFFDEIKAIAGQFTDEELRALLAELRGPGQPPK